MPTSRDGTRLLQKQIKNSWDARAWNTATKQQQRQKKARHAPRNEGLAAPRMPRRRSPSAFLHLATPPRTPRPAGRTADLARGQRYCGCKDKPGGRLETVPSERRGREKGDVIANEASCPGGNIASRHLSRHQTEHKQIMLRRGREKGASRGMNMQHDSGREAVPYTHIVDSGRMDAVVSQRAVLGKTCEWDSKRFVGVEPPPSASGLKARVPPLRTNDRAATRRKSTEETFFQARLVMIIETQQAWCPDLSLQGLNRGVCPHGR